MDKKELFKKVEGRLYSYKNLDIEIKSIELEIEDVQNEFLGCGSIEYGERTGVTYNINRTVENEVVKREKELMRLNHLKVKKEIEKRKIENSFDTGLPPVPFHVKEATGEPMLKNVRGSCASSLCSELAVITILYLPR